MKKARSLNVTCQTNINLFRSQTPSRKLKCNIFNTAGKFLSDLETDHWIICKVLNKKYNAPVRCTSKVTAFYQLVQEFDSL